MFFPPLYVEHDHDLIVLEFIASAVIQRVQCWEDLPSRLSLRVFGNISTSEGGVVYQNDLQTMPAKHTWAFKPRLRVRAFGWNGSRLACRRLKEAVVEIKKVARVDSLAAGDGVVNLMERIWPAFERIDTSSGALGSAVNWTQGELLRILIEAPADRKTRDRWLFRVPTCGQRVDGRSRSTR